MIIETMFDKGDDVFVMINSKVVQANVSAIFFNSAGIDSDDVDGITHRLTARAGLTYKLTIGTEGEVFSPEHKIFKTKEELLKSL